MKIGIILHSQTGNTKSVADKLREKLLTAGHTADLIQLQVVGGVKPNQKKNEIKFEKLPDLSPYDAFVLGSPVAAFSLSPVMKSYLEHVDSFKGKKLAMLITQYFPYSWMGGKQAAGYLMNACKAKGAIISGSAIINWSNKKRETKIVESVDSLSKLF